MRVRDNMKDKDNNMGDLPALGNQVDIEPVPTPEEKPSDWDGNEIIIILCILGILLIMGSF